MKQFLLGYLLCHLVMAFPVACRGQQMPVPILQQSGPLLAGGGNRPAPGSCLSTAQREAIEQRLSVQRAALQVQGLLSPSPLAHPAAVTLSWPLRQAAGFAYTSYYATTNFVDHNPAFPNALLDFNCGTRTVDNASGGNHAGTDIGLWPFAFNMMDRSQVEVVAAAAGIILGKDKETLTAAAGRRVLAGTRCTCSTPMAP